MITEADSPCDRLEHQSASKVPFQQYPKMSPIPWLCIVGQLLLSIMVEESLRRPSSNVSAWVATFMTSRPRYHPDLLTLCFTFWAFDTVHPIVLLLQGQLNARTHKHQTDWCLKVLSIESLPRARHRAGDKSALLCLVGHWRKAEAE